MAWLDLNTQFVHGCVIYRDAETVILWTSGGEAQVTAAEFIEPTVVDLDRLADNVRLALDDLGVTGDIQPRFLDLDPGATLPPAADARRAALETYAAGNGGTILVHQPQDRPSGLAGLARFGRDLFGGR